MQEMRSQPIHGRLVYVMGPSGAGKDSVLKTLRERAPETVWFAHRYITRSVTDTSENHVALTEAEFRVRHKAGCFSLAWSCNGYSYGVGIEIDRWLELGNTVVVNGSREAFSMVLERYPTLLPVVITADKTVLRARLTQRGRETAAEIEARLQRNDNLSIDHPELCTISNQQELHEAADALLSVIQSSK